jgi:hypothetical protein
MREESKREKKMKNKIKLVGYEVLTAVVMKSSIFLGYNTV